MEGQSGESGQNPFHSVIKSPHAVLENGGSDETGLKPG